MSSGSNPDDSRFTGSPGSDSRLLIIALGSNLGQSQQILETAVRDLNQTLPHRRLRVSSFLKSTPVDCPPGSPDFLNAVVAIDWFPPVPDLHEAAEQLLLHLKAMERQAGRVRKTVLNEPRPLDLDIIHIEGYHHHSPSLIIPHPRATERSFVMDPIREIVPDFDFQ
jgi:2-amino-4-hydroxy-6-hydroxymethyldihydropteridine diphosphokinase